MNFTYPPGATPIDPDELQGLIPPDISTQEQLNAAEQKNIAEAEMWVFSRKRKNILTEPFLRRLHQKMFQTLWRWAGKYRESEKNLGVDPHHIREEIQKFLKDASYWIENKTYDTWEEFAAKFYHRLVWIHPFVNGNGRHARLLTDILLVEQGQKRPSWGARISGDLSQKSEKRSKHIEALQHADNHLFDKLIHFINS